jgi:hypothetical protein
MFGLIHVKRFGKFAWEYNFQSRLIPDDGLLRIPEVDNHIGGIRGYLQTRLAGLGTTPETVPWPPAVPRPAERFRRDLESIDII